MLIVKLRALHFSGSAAGELLQWRKKRNIFCSRFGGSANTKRTIKNISRNSSRKKWTYIPSLNLFMCVYNLLIYLGIYIRSRVSSKEWQGQYIICVASVQMTKREHLTPNILNKWHLCPVTFALHHIILLWLTSIAYYIRIFLMTPSTDECFTNLYSWHCYECHCQCDIF